MYDNIIFDGVIIPHIENLRINSVITDSLPSVNISQGKLARADGTKIYNKEYGSKTINIEGHIQAKSRDSYLTARALLLKATEPINKVLQLPQDGTPLEYTATCSNVIFSDIGGGFARFSIEFICTDPFGYDVNTRVLLNGTTTSTATDTFNFLEVVGGTMPSPPIITVAVASVTGGTTSYIELTSGSGETIRVTRDWVDDDVLEIDCLNLTVKINGVLTDYTGVFWFVNVDDSTMSYEDTFTTRTVGVTVTYKRRYL